MINKHYANEVKQLLDKNDFLNSAITEINAIIDYSDQCNHAFPPATNVEFLYMIIAAEKCAENMKKSLFRRGGEAVKKKYEALSILFDQSVQTISMAIPRGEENDT